MTSNDATDPTGMVIAVDGTSGSGKSSTSRGVAHRLGLRYLDTGAMFRAMTWWLLEQDVDVHQPAAVAARCAEPVIDVGTDPDQPTITVDAVDVSGPIRSAAVTGAVSPVSTVPEVRARLLGLQREVITDAVAQGDGIVVEGRDIGSVVWPDAPVKVYLSAAADQRAVRRAAQQGEQGAAALDATRASLESRDRIDSGRTSAPLVMVDGAIHVDTTSHTLDEVIDRVVALASGVRADA